MPTVLMFGTFDPLHDGHRACLKRGAALGEKVLVVAARDSYIRTIKRREPRVSAEDRKKALEEIPEIARVIWGDEWPAAEPYRLLRDLQFDVIALGHDQQPADEIVRAQLQLFGKKGVKLVRLPRYKFNT